MVVTADQIGRGVVSGNNAGIFTTHSLIVALRFQSKSTVALPPLSVCERLRTLGLWTPCGLLCSRSLEVRFVQRRGGRAGPRVQRVRPSPSSADHCLRSSSMSADSRSALVFATHNVRSLLNKYDEIVRVCRNILCLSESAN